MAIYTLYVLEKTCLYRIPGFFYNLAPDDINNINNLFTNHETSYNSKDNLRLDLVCSKSKASRHSFTHRAGIVWNCLRSQLSPSLATLFSRLERH